MPEQRPPTPEELLEYFHSTMEHVNAANCLYVCTVVEKILARLIQLLMPNLSNRLRANLFSGYGPLASFSAKIDIAYALDLIPQSTRRTLHAIREIRNGLAHPEHDIDFNSDDMERRFKKFSDYDPSSCNSLPEKAQFFIQKIGEVLYALGDKGGALTMAEEHESPAADTSPE